MQNWEFLKVRFKYDEYKRVTSKDSNVHHLSGLYVNGKNVLDGHRTLGSWEEKEQYNMTYLNRLGQEGWELVNGEDNIFILKRPLR